MKWFQGIPPILLIVGYHREIHVIYLEQPASIDMNLKVKKI